MLYFVVLTVFITTLLFSYMVMVSFNKRKLEMAERINSIEHLEEAYVEEEYGESVVAVLYKSLGEFLLRRTPKYKTNRQKKQLEKAGVLRETSAERWIARKAMVILLSGLVSFFIVIFLKDDVALAFLGALFTIGLVNYIYRFYLLRKISTRTEAIIKTLPFSLDLITVSVEAGLSLDGAIGKIVGSIEGPLSDEFAITLKEMRMGIEKKEALKNMSERVGNKDLSMLLSSIIQADELGVSLGKILRIEGDQLREKRKQSAKEKAMKAPVKMLFPLMFFIFPSIFIIILGPALINMADKF